MEFETINLKIENKIAHIRINRPDKANSLTETSFTEITNVFNSLSENPEARVIIISGEGKHFCGGIDLELLGATNEKVKQDCEGRMREKLRDLIKWLQAPMNAVANCKKPVIAAIQGGCIGAGLDLAAACDMRYVTEDAFFTIKEIDMGMVADLGSIQRLEGIVGHGVLREMAYTGRHISGAEATQTGLANQVFAATESMMQAVQKIAENIATKSPLSIRGSKEMLNFARDHSVAEGLNYIATWNAAMILSNDLQEAFMAQMQKRKPEFKD